MFCVGNSTEQYNSASDNILLVSPVSTLHNEWETSSMLLNIKFSISENGSHWEMSLNAFCNKDSSDEVKPKTIGLSFILSPILYSYLENSPKKARALIG